MDTESEEQSIPHADEPPTSTDISPDSPPPTEDSLSFAPQKEDHPGNDISRGTASDGNLKLRKYQLELTRAPLQGTNSIICAPRGSGKTVMAGHVIHQLSLHQKNPQDPFKALFIVSIRKSVQQKSAVLGAFLNRLGLKVGVIDERRNINVNLESNTVVVLTAMMVMNAIKNGIFKLTDVDLLVFDECHHAYGGHPYNELMRAYLEAKLDNHIPGLPQILGLTVCLGTGNSKTVRDNLLTLCGNLDCQQISQVRENLEELAICNPKTDEVEIIAVPGRPKNDPLCVQLIDFIKKIEKKSRIMSKVSPGTQAYETWAVTKRRTAERKKRRDKIVAFSALLAVNSCLMYYEALDGQDALKILQDHFSAHSESRDKTTTESSALDSESSAPLNRIKTFELRRGNFVVSDTIEKTVKAENARDVHIIKRMAYESKHSFDEALKNVFKNKDVFDGEEKWSHDFTLLMPELTKLTGGVENNLLLRLVSLLQRLNDKNCPVKGLILTQTRFLTERLVQYIKDRPELTGIVRPARLTGQKGDQYSMTEEEQEDVLQQFNNGRINLLIATDVAAEGVDIQDCDYLIQYNVTTNEIGALQSRSIARACYLIVREGSDVEKRELENKKRIRYLQETLEQLQNNNPAKLVADIEKKQKEDWDSYKDIKKHHGASAKNQSLLYSANLVEIVCLHCSNILSTADQIRKKGTYYICVDAELPKRVILNRWDETDKRWKVRSTTYHAGEILCGDDVCSRKLGLIVQFREGTRREGYVLSRQRIMFDLYGKELLECKSWGTVPFRVKEEAIDE